MEFKELWRRDNAANDAAEWAKHGGGRRNEEVGHADGFPVFKRMEHMQASNRGQERVKGDKDRETQEVEVTCTYLGRDTMMFKQKDPKSVPEATAA